MSDTITIVLPDWFIAGIGAATTALLLEDASTELLMEDATTSLDTEE